MFVDDGPAEQGPEITAWLASCRESLRAYFALEDPRRLEPAERELYVETLLDSRLLLRGFVDRIDVAPDGAIRVVDYKTGRSPGVGLRGQGAVPDAVLRAGHLAHPRRRAALLRLVYLGDGQMVSYEPDEQDLLATERLVEAIWHAIEQARASGEWLPNPGWACGWCSFQAHCPAFGNEPPPLPDLTTAAGPGDAGPTAPLPSGP